MAPGWTYTDESMPLSASPLATVTTSVDEIAGMLDRASAVSAAVCLLPSTCNYRLQQARATDKRQLGFLVDLKQKQSNVMDAHFMRNQAIETARLTTETVKQGKTLMVFTVATIIFVSL